jgi:MFS family permease
MIKKDSMFYRFCAYGFLKNLRFFDPFLVLFFRDAGLSFFQIGILYSIRDLSTGVLEIPTGVYADAYGRRGAMVMAFVSYIASFMVFFLLPGFYPFIGAMLFFALGEALRTGTHKALILEYLKLNDMEDLKVGYYGRTRAASQLGAALNSLIGAALVFYTGNYRYIFVASVVPYLLDLFNLWSYPKVLDGELHRFERGVIVQRARATLGSFFAIFRSGHALRAILNSAGFNAFYKSSKDYLQPILNAFAISLPFLVGLDDTRRSSVIIGLVYFVIYLMSSYASRSADQVEERLPGLAMAINVTFLAGAAALFLAGLTAWQDVRLLSIVVFLLLFVLYNVRRPLTVAFVSDQIAHEVMASGLSAESQASTLIMVALAPALGALADAFGVGAALAAIGALMIVVWPGVRAQDRQALRARPARVESGGGQ